MRHRTAKFLLKASNLTWLVDYEPTNHKRRQLIRMFSWSTFRTRLNLENDSTENVKSRFQVLLSPQSSSRTTSRNRVLGLVLKSFEQVETFEERIRAIWQAWLWKVSLQTNKSDDPVISRRSALKRSDHAGKKTFLISATAIKLDWNFFEIVFVSLCHRQANERENRVLTA